MRKPFAVGCNRTVARRHLFYWFPVAGTLMRGRFWVHVFFRH